jgi:rare lipoprotein A
MTMLPVRVLLVAMLCLALSPAQAGDHHAKAGRPHGLKAEKKPDLATHMVASVYSEGTGTASGRKFDPNGMTAAHRTMPFGTRLLITYSGSMVEVVVNDRGPFVHGRDIDLSRGAAKALHFSGVGRVKVAYWPPVPAPRPEAAPPRLIPAVELSAD